MPSPEEEKILICGAKIVYQNARSILETLDFMLAMAKGSALAAVQAYDDAIRPLAEAIIAAAEGQEDDDHLPDSPAAV